MSSAPRYLGGGVTLGLAAGLLVGVGLLPPGRATAASPSAVPAAQVNSAAGGAAGAAPAVTAGGTTVVAQAGSAIAYPYFAGAPGVAPDHTIVVTGVGQADMASDGSDRAAAEQRALDAALADAKGQATAIAAVTGLSISGVLSVSATVSPAYEPLPLAGSASGGAAATPVPPVRGATGSGVPLSTLPAPVAPPIYPQTLNVAVTVEYGVG